MDILHVTSVFVRFPERLEGNTLYCRLVWVTVMVVNVPLPTEKTELSVRMTTESMTPI